MAQYAVLIYANDSAHALEATAADTEACDQHAQELAGADSMLCAYALTSRDMAVSVRADSIIDGRFTDSKEIVAGFYIIEAPDLDTALAIAGTNPVIREGGGGWRCVRCTVAAPWSAQPGDEAGQRSNSHG